MRWREGFVWIAAAVLLVVIGIVSAAGTPDFAPVTMRYSSAAEAPAAEPTEAGEKININTAGKETLMRLNGVGETLAARIIQFRESHGDFQTVEELLEVEGIGKKRLAAWKPFIVV